MGNIFEINSSSGDLTIAGGITAVGTVNATIVTGTTGQFGGNVSAQSGSFSTGLTISGIPVNIGDTITLTASRAVVSDVDGALAASATTATELAYLSGLSSNAQTQFNGKLNLSGPATFFGRLTAQQNLVTEQDEGCIRAYGYSPSYALLDKDAVTAWFLGIDDDDSDALVIARGVSPAAGNPNAIHIDSSDRVLLSAQLTNSGTTGSEMTNSNIRLHGYSPALELLDKDAVQNWYVGIDDDDSDSFKIAGGYGPGQGEPTRLKLDGTDQFTFNAETQFGYTYNFDSPNRDTVVKFRRDSSEGPTGSEMLVMFEHYSGTASGSCIPIITGMGKRGTKASPVAVGNTNALFIVDGRGYDGSAESDTSAQIAFVADEDWDGSSHGSYLSFKTTPRGSTAPVEQAKITHNGYLELTNDPISDPHATTKSYVDAQSFTSQGLEFSMSDNSAVRIDGAGTSYLLFAMTDGAAANSGGVYVGQIGQTTVTWFGGTNFHHIAASDTAPTGTSGTDGDLNFQAASSSATLWIINRLGGTAQVRLAFLGYQAQSGLTATAI